MEIKSKKEYDLLMNENKYRRKANLCMIYGKKLKSFIYTKLEKHYQKKWNKIQGY